MHILLQKYFYGITMNPPFVQLIYANFLKSFMGKKAEDNDEADFYDEISLHFIREK
jgi:hypothetical protein